MKHLHWKKIFYSGFWYMLIATIIQFTEAIFTTHYYMDPVYFGAWSKLMMPARIATQSVAGGPAAGPPPAIFYIISLIFTYAAGATVAAVFDLIKDVLGKSYWRRIVNFTDIIVGLTIVLGYFPMYLLFNVPLGLLAWWVGASWVTTLVAAMVFAKIIK